jgi:cell division transport system permease protein
VPFMLEGLVTGVIGGGLAWLGVWAAHGWFEDQIVPNGSLDFLQNLSVSTVEMRGVGLTVVLVGVIVGSIGSGVAVSRFLDV